MENKKKGKIEKTKRKEIREEVEVPEGINAEITENKIKISKGEVEVERKISYDVKKEGNKLVLECENPTKRDKKMIKTTTAHIRNIINGLEEKYLYKLQIASVHFPMNVAVQGGEVIIKNFLGEVKPRKAKILPGVEVKIEGEMVSVESHNKENAGQTAANIETAAKVKKKDRRIFQDGIFIIEKQKGARRKENE